AELVRLQGGDLDMTQSELRPDDYVAAKRAETQGKLKLVELGVGPDADAFWFDLKPEAWKNDPRFAFVSKREFRQAIWTSGGSWGVCGKRLPRRRGANLGTGYLGQQDLVLTECASLSARRHQGEGDAEGHWARGP